MSLAPRILIVEDEPPIAKYVENGVRSILGDAVRDIQVCHTLDRALHGLKARSIDLCLLDLNLSGEDGFEVLRQAAAQPFQTIVISAYVERAVEAFDYGVLDFVAKPFKLDRLRKALDRFAGREAGERRSAKYLAYRLRNACHIIAVQDIRFFKAVRFLVEAHPAEGPAVLLDKSLSWLETVLPPAYIRIHRSYIVDLAAVESYRHTGGSVYRIRLKSGVELPIGRLYLKTVQGRLNP